MSALYQFTYTPADDDETGDMIAALLDAYTSESGLARVLGVRQKTVLYWRQGGTPQRRNLELITELYEHLIAWEVGA